MPTQNLRIDTVALFRNEATFNFTSMKLEINEEQDYFLSIYL